MPPTAQRNNSKDGRILGPLMLFQSKHGDEMEQLSVTRRQTSRRVSQQIYLVQILNILSIEKQGAKNDPLAIKWVFFYKKTKTKLSYLLKAGIFNAKGSWIADRRAFSGKGMLSCSTFPTLLHSRRPSLPSCCCCSEPLGCDIRAEH